MRGKLVKWNEARGFGFIRPDGFDYDIFVHISGFKDANRRPIVSEDLVFSIETDGRGKHRAVGVSPAEPDSLKNRHGSRRPSTRSSQPWGIWFGLVFILVLIVAAMAGTVNHWIPIWYLGVSFLTYLFYASDKSAALADRWRVPELTLQGLAFAGGWPGGLIAQQRLRHKNRKSSFQIVFWLSVAMNVVALYLIVRGMSLSA